MTKYFIDNCGDLEQRSCSESELRRDRELMQDATSGDSNIIRWNEELQAFEVADVRPDQDEWMIDWSAP